MSDTGPSFDPRFDPAFQPGYEPRPEAPASRRPVIGGPPRGAGRPAAPGEVIRAPAPIDVPRPPLDEGDDELGDLFDAEAHEAMRRSGVNPFSVALWAASVVLVAAGIVVYRTLPLLETQTGGTGGFVFSQLLALGFVAGGAICLGVATALVQLVVLGLRWDRS